MSNLSNEELEVLKARKAVNATAFLEFIKVAAAECARLDAQTVDADKVLELARSVRQTIHSLL